MTDACELSAVDARRLIGEKRLSPVELLDSCIAQIERVNPAVNAVVTTAFDRARMEARAAEAAVMRGDPLPPLHGLPVAIKDTHITAGVRTTYGSPHYKDNVPERDDHVVESIRAAGGIVHAKTNVPELGIGGNTVNRLFGATGNPFGLERTCGGSSGGSAAALAANMAPLASGSDTGGSLRLPACFCGVVAHRPSAGVVAHGGRALAQSYYNTQGPMARTAGDAALLLAAMARRSRRDPMAYPLDPDQFLQLDEIDLSGLRVAVSPDLGGVPVSDVVRRTFAERVERFQGAFKVCEWRSPAFADAMDVFWKLRSIVFIAQYYREIDGYDADFNPNIRSNYQSALKMDLKEVAVAHRRQMELYQDLQNLFESFDVLLCPGVSIPPFPWRDLFPKAIDGMPSNTYVDWVGMTSALTITGHPITALPCGLDPTGAPFGIQVIGPNFADRFTLGVAQSLERLFEADDALRRPVPGIARRPADSR
ncbi:amidase [Azospirillum canadense]|uniref:amidase n=1 Tax=Azospirillum canadense TaxID=403962 RepID=UPI002226002B|nr:amidase [Azospirillum canadense]MCW2240522.1 Asp-tRNA(Asn)/Glu-tRNA(Gln) amidotransferase A subunit family amidase [Azospirillum canadense]